MMRRANKYLSPRAKRTLYYGQIHSNLSYSIGIWGPMISKKQLKDLSGIQQKCVDLIYDNKSKSSFTDCKIPTLKQLIMLEQCKIGYKLCKKLLPKGLANLLTTDHEMRSIEKSHSYSTRSKIVPNRPSAKLTLYRKSFLYNSIKHYSLLPIDIRNATNLSTFVRGCKKALQIIL